ncbi:MAG: TlpA family protein disulfide reductase [Caldiserica bacterium]|nr:TlpA family protein disulfide reductase [Caldisericota bacterium]
MRKIFVGVVLLLALPYLVFAQEKQAADFALKNLQGEIVKLSDFQGKVIILNFWATWCPPCRKEIPFFVELQKKYGEKGLQVIGISIDRGGVKVLKRFAKKYEINYPVLLADSEVTKKYGGIVGIPTTFIINQKGGIVKKFIGYREKAIFESEVKQLLNLP